MAEAKAPSWIDAAFIQEALRRGGEEGAAVKSVTLKSLGAAGDHYASTMFRVTAETASGTRSLIVKSPPEGEALRKAVEEAKFFPAESLLLSEIVPRMHSLLEGAAPGNAPAPAPAPALAARCLHHGDRPQPFLVIEDLAPAGFVLADRHRGLGLRHALLALRCLARFHAASAALLGRDPAAARPLQNPFRTPDDSFKTFVKRSFEGVAKACRNFGDSLSEYADSIEALADTAFERLADINDYKPGRFNVIIHGDFWLNNMMFRYEKGHPQDIRLVDLQLSHVTTPAVDLLYFLNCSVSEDISRNHTDLLIREYHHALKQTMDLLGLEAPSLSEFLRDLEENAFYATLSAFGVLPIVKTVEVPDLEKSLSKDDSSADNDYMYATPTVRRWLTRLLPQFRAKGLLI